MAGIEQFFSEGERVLKKRKRMILTILLVVVGLHLAFGLVAGVLVVARYIFPPPATFEVKRDIRLPAKQREHKMNMAAFDAMTPKPSFNDKMQSMQPAPFALPDLPEVPMDQMLPLDPAAIVSDQVSSLVGTAGLGAGGQGAGGLGGTGTGFSFMGVESNGRRILILFDVSDTTIRKTNEAGFGFERIREETKKLIDTVPASTRFGLVMFARNYVFMNSELVAATDSNREAAKEWLDKWFTDDAPMTQSVPNMVRGSPGLRKLLEAAGAVQPDVMFIVSDGGFYEGSSSSGSGHGRRIPYKEIAETLSDIQDSLPEKMAVNFIGAGMDRSDLQEMRRIINREGGTGKFRELKR
jgi:hypothetical protein